MKRLFDVGFASFLWMFSLLLKDLISDFIFAVIATRNSDCTYVTFECYYINIRLSTFCKWRWKELNFKALFEFPPPVPLQHSG